MSVASLLERRFDPAVVPELEKFLIHQIGSEDYSLDANVALLRFYKHQPSIAKVEHVGNILVKSLMALPDTDFLNCLFLIPQQIQQEPSISAIISLARNLETANFVAFWKEAEALKTVLQKFKGFDDAIREFIASVISISYKSISKSDIASLLKVDGGAVDALVSKKNWQVTGTEISFPENLRPVKAKNAREPIKFEQLAPVLTKIF